MQRSVAIATPQARLSDFVELTKPRITLMVVLTAAAGYYLGAEHIALGRLLNTVLGTGLLASGASALNQVIERDSDARMLRTQARPLPAGRLDAISAAGFGLLCSLLGAAYLYAEVNAVTGILGVVTLLLYVAVYTPMKRRSSLCTVVGAVPGALPPVMGWAAACDGLAAEAWILFAIMFLWQMPHFLAIASAYRDDYERGGQPMLPVIDPDGESTARQVTLYCLALLPISLLPAAVHLAGGIYFWGALGLSLAHLAVGLQTARTRSFESARHLLRFSVIYLPALLALMTFDKVPL
jgi:heme o synthase